MSKSNISTQNFTNKNEIRGLPGILAACGIVSNVQVVTN
jgi:hypothetical protein